MVYSSSISPPPCASNLHPTKTNCRFIVYINNTGSIKLCRDLTGPYLTKVEDTNNLTLEKIFSVFNLVKFSDYDLILRKKKSCRLSVHGSSTLIKIIEFCLRLISVLKEIKIWDKAEPGKLLHILCFKNDIKKF